VSGPSFELPEEAVLFPEEQIGPYTIKPWTLKQLNEVYPVLRVILGKLQEQGLTFENAETFFVERGLEAVQEILPTLPRLIAATLRIDESAAAEMPWADAAAVALRIFIQNIGVLKNFSSLIAGQTDAIRTLSP